MTSLKNAYDFKILCLKTDQQLRKNPDLSIKSEVHDEESLNLFEEIDIKMEPLVIIGEEKEIDESIDMISDDDDDDESYNDGSSDDEKLSEKKTRLKKSNPSFICAVCNNGYINKGSLTRHMKSHSSDLTITTSSKTTDDSRHQKKTYNCNKCNQDFEGHMNYNAHMKTHGYRCDICEKEYRNIYDLTRHQKNIHSGTDCDLCDKTFLSKKLLNDHKHMEHSKEKVHICNKCTRSFYDLESLEKHQLDHEIENKFICDECPKTFSTEHKLKLHKKTHIPEDNRKKWLCQLCGKSLLSQAGYNSHLAVHNDEKKFECQTCNKKFLAKHQLLVHIRSHVGQRPYQCKVCGDSFILMNHLRNHMIKHSEEKKFECELCGVTMKYRNNLRHHMKNVHWGIRNYPCDECDDKFYTSSLLRLHKTKIHPHPQ